MEKPRRLSSASRRAIIPCIGSVEQKNYETCTGRGVIHKKLYELVDFFQLYGVKFPPVRFMYGLMINQSIGSDGAIHAPVEISKLTLYTLAQSIWCPYYI